MKTLLIVLMATSCMADAGSDLQAQINHDEIVDQMKAQTAATKEASENGSPEALQINVPAEPLAPRCEYSLISKGQGYETFTFGNGKTALIYVKICDGQVQ